MARAVPTKDSSLRDIILYILEAQGEITETPVGIRAAAQKLSAGQSQKSQSMTLNFLLGNRPHTTKAEIQAAGWQANLRKISKRRFAECQSLYTAQLNLLAKDAASTKFVLPENFADTVLHMIGGKDNIQDAAQKLGMSTADLRAFAIQGRVPVTKESIDNLVKKLEEAFPDEAWISPLLRAYAEQHLTVYQAKTGKKANVELFRQVARELLTDIRHQLALTQSEVEERLKAAQAGTLGTNETPPRRISVARVAIGKVRAFEADEKMGASVFVSCIRSFSDVMFLERNNPKQHKLLGFLANAISPK
ncbi:MAG: hypothetical protein SFW65_05735 [Alphaproteobacteria bacterium]|nr:hypothetical protein [Alphaproteobacteria bacterium]